MAALATSLTLFVGALAAVGPASAAFDPTPTALELAAAMATAGLAVTSASFASVAGGTPAGVDDAPLTEFPRDGASFALLSTGNAQHARNPNNSGSTSTGNGGGHVRGNTDYDVVILRVDLSVPTGGDCLTVDFQFLSEEFPEYVGSGFNDAFIAELDVSDWTVSGSTISAPHNFAFDEFGNPITINQASMTAANAAGTTYDGATSLLRATTPVTAGAHSVYLSIFDQGDSGYDSTVFLDRLLVGTSGASGCEPGAAPPELSPPSAPQDLVASGGVGTIDLGWEAPFDDGGAALSHYTVYQRDAEGEWASVGTVDAGVLATTVAVASCASNDFRVTASNGEGESVPSNEATATSACVPSPPLLGASPGPGAGDVTLTWDAVAGATSYRVYRLDGGPTPILEVGGGGGGSGGEGEGGGTFTVIVSVGPCVAASFAVTALNEVGESAPSNDASATTTCAPGAPTGLNGALGPAVGEVTLTWSLPDPNDQPIDGFRVYRYDGPDATLKGEVDAATLQFVDVLGSCATGAYYVSAFNAAGEGVPSDGVVLTTLCPPTVPLDLAALPGPGLGEISLSWEEPENDGVDAYRVYGGAPGEDKVLLATVPALPRAYVDGGLGNGASFCYEIVALNDAGASAASNEDCATTFAPPGPVTDLAALAGIADVTLGWSAPAADGGLPLAGYNVYRDDAGALVLLAVLGSEETSFADALPSCSSAAYAVAAFNDAGEGELVSATVATPCAPGAPLEFVALAGVRLGSLSWEAPFSDGGRPIEAYNVYRGPTADELELVATLLVDERTYEEVLADCTTFHYAVTAVNAVGEGEAAASPLTTPCRPETPAAPVPSRVPQIDALLVTVAPHDLDLLLYGANEGEELAPLATLAAGTDEFVDAPLGAGVTRCYAASLLNDVGESDQSEAECLSTVRAPDAPGGLVARSGPDFGQVSLQWSPPADDGGRPVLGYTLYRSQSLDHSHPLANLEPDATGFVDDGLEDGAHFYYSIAARNEVGEGPASNVADGASWTREAESEPEPLPSGVAETGAIWQGQYAYVFGGLQGNGERSSTNAIVRFDPDTGETVALDLTLPTPRHDFPAVWIPGAPTTESCHPSCAFGGFGYIFGGDFSSAGAVGDAPASCHPSCFAGTDVLRYDPSQGLLEKVADLPEGLAGAAGVAVPLDLGDDAGDDSLTQSCHPSCLFGAGLLFGGNRPLLDGAVDDGHPASCHPSCASGFDDEILSFDPQTDQVLVLNARLPTPRTQTSATYANGFVYVFGGMDATGDLADILRYDPVTDTLATLNVQLPTPRHGTSAFWDGTAAYIVGGTSNGVPVDEIVRFDPAEATTQVAGELPSGREGTSVVYDGTTAHIFGGDDGNRTLDEVVQFTPTAPQNPNARPEPVDGAPATGPLTRGQSSSGAGRILVTWEPPANVALAPIAYYNVYRGSAPDTEVLYATVAADQVSFLDTGLPRGTTYYYKVSAVSEVGEGPQSDEVNATTTDLPGAPRDLLALPAGPGAVALSWQPPLSDGGEALRVYRVYRSSAGAGSGIALVGEVPASETTLSDPGCRLGTFCTYVVSAVNVHGQGPLSNAASALGTKV